MLTFIAFNDTVSFPYLSQILKQLDLIENNVIETEEEEVIIKQKLQ